MNQPNRHQNKVTEESLCIWLISLLFTISSLVLVTGLLLLGSKLEMLGTLDAQLLLALAFLTFHTKHNLTRSLGLLVKDGLCLTTETHLLRVVTTTDILESPVWIHPKEFLAGWDSQVLSCSSVLGFLSPSCCLVQEGLDLSWLAPHIQRQVS